MDNVVISEGASVKNAIIDKQVVVPPNAEIGYDLKSDRKRFDVTTSGIVIVAKRTSLE
jgi:glucose-1-phosphate adenylyltransferase